jgi:hypothetical protein
MIADEFLAIDDPAEVVAAVLSVMLFGLLLVGLVFVIRDTARGKGRWGVNTKRATCKKCGTLAPVVRKPKSLQQALWGGCTCAECGFELDKWGEPVPNQPEPAKWKLMEAAEAEEVEEVIDPGDSPSSGIKAPGQVKERDEGKSHD